MAGKDASGKFPPAVNKPAHRRILLGHPSRMGWMRKQIGVPCVGTAHLSLSSAKLPALWARMSPWYPLLVHSSSSTCRSSEFPSCNSDLQNIPPAANFAVANSLMVMWLMVSGATPSLRWEGPSWGKANKKVSQAWKCFCGSWDRNFSHTHPLPSIPPHYSVKLKHSSSNSRQVSSLHHPGIDYTCRWKLSDQNQDVSFAGGFSQCESCASPHLVAFQHPMSSQEGMCLLRQRHFTSYVFSLHGRHRNSRAAFLSNPTPLTARTGRKQQLLCVWIKPSCYLLLPTYISLDSKRIFKLQWQAGPSCTKD